MGYPTVATGQTEARQARASRRGRGTLRRCTASAGERFLRPHDAELVSLQVGEHCPGLGAGLPDVDRACPQRNEPVNLLKPVCRAAGQVEMHPVLDRLGIFVNVRFVMRRSPRTLAGQRVSSAPTVGQVI